MQRILGLFRDRIQSFELPDPDEMLMPGVCWGRVECFFTPSYWAAQMWLTKDDRRSRVYRLTNSLHEEAVACLLGGHGITEEMSCAAFSALSKAQLLMGDRFVSEDEIEEILRRPMVVNGRAMRYRFPKVKARYVSSMLSALLKGSPPLTNPHDFRRWFLNQNGVGFKTASWITRNWLNTTEIAVIDIHIERFGRRCGLFGENDLPGRDYLKMEGRFITFSRILQVHPSELDVLIWNQMRLSGAGNDKASVAA